MGNRISCNRAAFRLGATFCKMIEGFPHYSAGVSKIYALNSTFPTLFAFRVKALHQIFSGLGCFFTVCREHDSFVVAVTLLIPCRDEPAAVATRDDSFCCHK